MVLSLLFFPFIYSYIPHLRFGFLTFFKHFVITKIIYYDALRIMITMMITSLELLSIVADEGFHHQQITKFLS